MLLKNSASNLNIAFKDLKNDVKAIRWLRGLGWSIVVIWFLGLMFCAVFVGLMPMILSNDTACLPDGSFSLHPDTYSMWSSTGFFQITLGGGELTFAKAKVIDIVWDIVGSLITQLAQAPAHR